MVLKPFDLRRLDAVLETLTLLRGMLGPETALIGFCGAPFTVASYMVAGRSSPDQAPVRTFAYRQPADFAALIEALVDASAEYLLAQVKAGAEVLQIFDSWAGVLPEAEFLRWSAKPMAAIVAKVRSQAPDVPIIAFPREAGTKMAIALDVIGDAAIGLGTAESLPVALNVIPAGRVTQGNLDPLALLAGGPGSRECVCEASSTQPAAGRMCSILATAFCRRRRSTMCIGCCRLCGAGRGSVIPDGRRPIRNPPCLGFPLSRE